MKALVKFLILFLLPLSSNASKWEELVSPEQLQASKDELLLSLTQPNIDFSHILEQLSQLEIRDVATVSSKWSRLWCSSPTTYEITVDHPLHAGETFKVVVEHFRPKRWQRLSRQDRHSIVVTPATGGEDALEINHAWYFCDWEIIEAVRIASWQGDSGVNRPRDGRTPELKYLLSNPYELSFKKHDRGSVLNLAAIKTALLFVESLAEQGDTHPQRVGILGSSVGGIAAGIATAQFTEIDKSAIVVAGGPIYKIIASSEETSLSALREIRMSLLGLESVEQYQSLTEQHVIINPFSNGLEGKRVFMVTAGNDTTVPSFSQSELYEIYQSLGVNVIRQHEPESDHRNAIVEKTLLNTSRMSEIGEFFKSNQ